MVLLARLSKFAQFFSLLTTISLSKVGARVAKLEDIRRLGCALTESLVHLLKGFLGR